MTPERESIVTKIKNKLSKKPTMPLESRTSTGSQIPSMSMLTDLVRG